MINWNADSAKCGKTIKIKDIWAKAFQMCNNRISPHSSQFGKSTLLAEMTKLRHTISLSILVLVWKMNQNGAESRSWACLCETHECCLQHKTHENWDRKAGQGWAVSSLPWKFLQLHLIFRCHLSWRTTQAQTDSADRRVLLLLPLVKGHAAFSPPCDSLALVKLSFARRVFSTSWPALILPVKTSLLQLTLTQQALYL